MICKVTECYSGDSGFTTSRNWQDKVFQDGLFKITFINFYLYYLAIDPKYKEQANGAH